MSNDNLDDFFKKRDKKKKTAATKSKFQKLDTEEFAKQLEAAIVIEDTEASADATASTPHAAEPVLIAPAAPIDALPPAPVHSTAIAPQTSGKQHGDNFDEDWKPFESDDNKDYSGLRVNILQNWKDDEYYEESEETEAGTEKKLNCPWSQRVAAGSQQEQETAGAKEAGDDEGDKNNNTKTGSSEAAEEAKAAAGSRYMPPHLRSSQAAPAPAPAAPALAPPSAYVPPALRKQQGSGGSLGDSAGFQTQQRRFNRNQPNINDICEFPSLGDMTPQSSATGAETTATKTDNKFEQPKRMGKTAETGNRNQTIDLENKFNALSY